MSLDNATKQILIVISFNIVCILTEGSMFLVATILCMLISGLVNISVMSTTCCPAWPNDYHYHSSLFFRYRSLLEWVGLMLKIPLSAQCPLLFISLWH